MSWLKNLFRRSGSINTSIEIDGDSNGETEPKRSRLDTEEEVSSGDLDLQRELNLIDFTIREYEKQERLRSMSQREHLNLHSVGQTGDDEAIGSYRDTLPPELTPFLKQLMPWQLLALTNVWPDSKTQILDEVFNKQKFLWLCPVGDRRFQAHEDCCDLCDHILDADKFCCRVRSRTHLSHILEWTPAFDSLKDLRCLRLFRFNISTGIAEKLKEICPKLTHLDLTECRIDCSFRLVSGFKQLEHLILTSTGIDSKILANMISYSEEPYGRKVLRLKTLAINGTKVKDKELSSLPKTIDVQTIERLDIRCCPMLKKVQWSDFFNAGFDRMRVLRLEAILNDSELKAMSINLKNLNVLELHISEADTELRFTKRGLAQIRHLKELVTLKFVGHWNIPKVPIPVRVIVQGCKKISSFTINNINETILNNLSAEDLIFMTRNWSNLEKLELKNISSVNENVIAGFKFDPTGGPRTNTTLKYLDLSFCTGFHDQAVINCIHSLTGLRYLILDGCHQLTEDTFEAVVQRARAEPTVVFTAQFLQCNFVPKYFKLNEYPANLRVSLSSLRAKRYRNFDGLLDKNFHHESLRLLQ